MPNGYRTLSQHLNDLKKENFSLKLRIYFLEERMQQKYDDSSEDIYKRNIELKVEVESLKQELHEKTELLEKASKAVQSLSNQTEAEIHQKYEERQQEAEHVQAVLQNKLQLLQEEANLARAETQKVITAVEAEKLQCLELEKKLKEWTEQNQESPGMQEPNNDTLAEKDRIIDQLNQALGTKDAMIEQLNKEKENVLNMHVGGLENRVGELTDTLQQKENKIEALQDELGREKLRTQQEMQNLIAKQQQQLRHYECAADQCGTELHEAQAQTQGLQVRIQETEAINKVLQEKLSEMECELKDVRQVAQKQEQSVQALSETRKNKDEEAEDLYHVIDSQNETLTKLREMLHRSQLESLKRCAACQGAEGKPGTLQAELLELQSASFSNQLSLQRQQRLVRQKGYELAEAQRCQGLIQAELQETKEQKVAAVNLNQELRNTIQQIRQELQEKERQYKALETEHERELNIQEQSIECLKENLRDKEHFLQQYIELFDCQQSTKERDPLVDKLRERIKERDKALERAIDDKFSTLEEKEGEIRQLHLALREKERDLDRVRCILSNNEETISSLDGLIKGKGLELEQTTMAYRSLQWLKQEVEEKHGRALKEKETVIAQLQAALHARNRELEDLTVTLVNKVCAGAGEVTEQLRLRLQVKERMLQEALADRSAVAAEHERELQELLRATDARHQQMKSALEGVTRTIAERDRDLQALCRELAEKEREVAKKSVCAQDLPMEIARLRERLQEKERLINELVQDSPSKNQRFIQLEPMELTDQQQTVPEKEAAPNLALAEDEAMLDIEHDNEALSESQQIKEELQLALRRGEESRLELATLQAALPNQERESRQQALEIEALTRSICVKEEFIKDLQMQLVHPTELPEVERLSQELLSLRERMADTQSPTQRDQQQQLSCALQEQVLEQQHLTEALQAERQLYASLIKNHHKPDSSSRERTLETELTAVQALRERLEEVLGTSRERVGRLARDPGTPADSGELHLEGVDNSHFGDGFQPAASNYHPVLVECSHQKAIMETGPEQQVTGSGSSLAGDPQGLRRDLEEAMLEIQHLAEQKTLLEGELSQIKAQTAESGYTSVPQMRSALLGLHLEIAELKDGEGEDLTGREWWKEESKEKLNEWGQREIRKLKVKLGNAETISGLLKQQLELNSSLSTEGTFNPELIVNMAKEIERLKAELSLAQSQRARVSVQLRDGSAKRARPHSLDLGNFLSQCREQTPELKVSSQEVAAGTSRISQWQHTDTDLRHQSSQLRAELAECRLQNRELQEKLMMTEATVKAQDDQLNHCRVLLAESLVEQDNKQVQVDLQDLGYETCGRSENEADREEASSPEYGESDFQELLYPAHMELQYSASDPNPGSPSEPRVKSCLRKGLSVEDFGRCSDVALLQQHVQSLKAQLSKSDKIIHNLQCRVRSISTTSDYASSVERPHGEHPHFAATQPNDEDLWQTDSAEHFQVTAQPSTEIKQLIQRVTSLEAQLKSAKLMGPSAKNTTWPGKYDSLIQAQARELSHLRQKMREGKSIGQILKQHLSDTTKSFEELLRANDIDYYMGQSFRDQLSQGCQMAEKVVHKLTGRDISNLSNKGDQEVLVVRLSKELQHKNKTIESLHAKLQTRSETPCSSRTLSESEPSDRASFVSDDQVSTNDELDAYREELESASDYSQDDQRSAEHEAKVMTDNQSHSENPSQHSPFPSVNTSPCGAHPNSKPSMPSSQQPATDTAPAQKGLFSSSALPGLDAFQASYCANWYGQVRGLPIDSQPPLFDPAYAGAPRFSLAEVQQELHMLQRQLGTRVGLSEHSVKAVPTDLSFSGASTSSSLQLDAAGYVSQCHSAPRQELAGSGELKDILRAANSYLDSSAMWETARRPTMLGDISSGSSGYQSGSNLTGTDLLEEHLREIRSLRQRLEESICTNDRLRQQLEVRLAAAAKESAGAPTSIYIQGLETMTQLTEENRKLRDENLTIEARLALIPREHKKELEQLKEVLLTTRARLKLTEAEMEQWSEENKRLQAEVRDRQQDLVQLREEQRCTQSHNNRLLQEVNMLHQQLNENCQLIHSLQSEVQLYESLYGQGKRKSFTDVQNQFGNPCAFDISEFLVGIRSLRIQLEQSIHANSSLRKQLEQQLDEQRQCSINISHLISSQREDGRRKQAFQDCVPSPPVRDIGMLSPFKLHSRSSSSVTDFSTEEGTYQKHNDGYLSDVKNQSCPPAMDEVPPDGSFAKKNGRHMIGHVDDYNALQQQILEGRMLVQSMESIVQSCVNAAFLEINGSKNLDHQTVKQLFSSTNSLRQILDEACSLLKMFWRAALPNPNVAAQSSKKEQSMKEEIFRLRSKIAEQEDLLHNAISRLKATNQVKDGMEQFIVNQLTRTHDVLKKARSNLESVQMNDCSTAGVNICPSPSKAEIPFGCSPGAWGFVIPKYPEVAARSLGQNSLSGKDQRYSPKPFQVGNIATY
eukprot:gi/632955994/ref/XP_007893740.1/ PREDICTED: myomegalin-like isoform X8 [Callorhinchus milii]